MSMNKFEPYQNPNQSRLEKWRNEITEMRSLNWPYPAIAKWLLDEQQLKISKEAIRQFCKLRNITKGKKTKTIAKQVQLSSPKPVQQTRDGIPPEDNKFTYEAKPIDVHNNK